jgi:hypothetical protein
MPSMQYEPNAVTYNTCLYDQDGNLHRVSHLYERFVSKRLSNVEAIQSYDDGYVNSPLLDVRFAHKLIPIVILTDKGRKIYATAAQQIMTADGFVTVDTLGMRTDLKVLDFSLPVVHQYGHRKYSRGKYRVQAFLRANQIGFADPDERDYDGATITDDFEIYCVDYDTEHPVIHQGIVTLGLNNYRSFLMKHYDVGESSYDKVRKMYTLSTTKHCLTVEVGGTMNYIVHTGVIFKTSPHTGHND